MRLSARWRRPLFTVFMSFGMALFMSAVITAVNTGLGGGFVGRWLHAFALAFPVALGATYVWAPVATHLADALVGRQSS